MCGQHQGCARAAREAQGERRRASRSPEQVPATGRPCTLRRALACCVRSLDVARLMAAACVPSTTMAVSSCRLSFCRGRWQAAGQQPVCRPGQGAPPARQPGSAARCPQVPPSPGLSAAAAAAAAAHAAAKAADAAKAPTSSAYTMSSSARRLFSSATSTSWYRWCSCGRQPGAGHECSVEAREGARLDAQACEHPQCVQKHVGTSLQRHALLGCSVEDTSSNDCRCCQTCQTDAWPCLSASAGHPPARAGPQHTPGPLGPPPWTAACP